jgi:murein DD-endopeptidase MepM/ murein hydrolase activator NlpD
MPARTWPRGARRKRALFLNEMAQMRRRRFLIGASLSLAASPLLAEAEKPVRFSITGALQQGSLALGSAPPGSLVALDGRPLRVTADGRFAFGFGPDQAKPALVTVRYPGGGGDSRAFTPAVRHYEIQRVNGLPQKTVTPPPEVSARIAHEAETIYLARFTDSGGADFLSGFDWPAPGLESGVFGSQRIDNGVPVSPHYGVDMAAPVGTPIRAPADGVVAISDDYYLDGGFTLIDHGQGVSTSYLHQSKRLVQAGEAVKRGQRIGLIGATGRATGPHLHWAMNWFQVRLDPSLSTRKPKPDPL